MKMKQEYNDDPSEQSYHDQSYGSFLDNSSNVSVKQEFQQDSPPQLQNEGEAPKPKRKKGRPFGKLNYSHRPLKY